MHADGAVFAGGLWSVRTAIPLDLRNTFDKLILKSMSLSGNEETFDDQYDRILSLMSDDALLLSYVDIAQIEFDRRILRCVRVGTYIDSDTPTFFLPFARSIGQDSSTRLSTIPAKVLLSARQSDWGLEITWTQKSSSFLGNSNLGYAKAPIFAYIGSCDFALNTQNLSRLDEADCPATRVELPAGKLDYSFSSGGGKDLYVLFAHDHPASISMSPTVFQFQGVMLMVCFPCAFNTKTRYAVLILSFFNVALVLMFLLWRIVSCFRRRRSKPISTSWYKQPVHAIKKSNIPRRVMSVIFFMSFVTAIGMIVTLILGLFIFPWYIRLLSEIAYIVGIGMGAVDLISFVFLYRNSDDRKLVGAFGIFCTIHLVFLVVSLCGELNLFTAAAGDILAFTGVVVGGLGRFVSLCVLWRRLFLVKDGRSVDPLLGEENDKPAEAVDVVKEEEVNEVQ